MIGTSIGPVWEMEARPEDADGSWWDVDSSTETPAESHARTCWYGGKRMTRTGAELRDPPAPGQQAVGERADAAARLQPGTPVIAKPVDVGSFSPCVQHPQGLAGGTMIVRSRHRTTYGQRAGSWCASVSRCHHRAGAQRRLLSEEQWRRDRSTGTVGSVGRYLRTLRLLASLAWHPRLHTSPRLRRRLSSWTWFRFRSWMVLAAPARTRGVGRGMYSLRRSQDYRRWPTLTP